MLHQSLHEEFLALFAADVVGGKGGVVVGPVDGCEVADIQTVDLREVHF